MDRTPILVAVAGPLEGQRFPVTEDGLMMGREETCAVVIQDKNVSRVHARLLLHNSSVWVQDAGSRNGVFVNDKRVVRHQQLSPGDALVVGEHQFTLELENPPSEVTSTFLIQRERQPIGKGLIAVFLLGSLGLMAILAWGLTRG